MNVRRGKGTSRNAHQSAQYDSHLNQPVKEIANKSSAPNTARYPMLKHQKRDKDTEKRIKDGDASKKRKAWVPPEASTGRSGPHGRI